MSSDARSVEAGYLKKGVNLAVSVFRLLERPEEAAATADNVETLAGKLKTIDSLAAAHDLVFQVAAALALKARKPYDVRKSADDEDRESGSEEEYVKLEKELQKYEAKVRTYIRNEQQMKLHIESLERKIEQMKDEQTEAEKQTKLLKKEMEKKDLEIAKLREGAKKQGNTALLMNGISMEEESYAKKPLHTNNLVDPDDDHFKFGLNGAERSILEKKLNTKKEFVAKSGEKQSSGVKKMAVLKDWKSSSKKNFKDAPPSIEPKKDSKESKKKPSTAVKETRDIGMLTKQLSSRLFAGDSATKQGKKVESKKQPVASRESRDRESREGAAGSNQLLLAHQQLIQNQIASAIDKNKSSK